MHILTLNITLGNVRNFIINECKFYCFLFHLTTHFNGSYHKTLHNIYVVAKRLKQRGGKCCWNSDFFIRRFSDILVFFCPKGSNYEISESYLNSCGLRFKMRITKHKFDTAQRSCKYWKFWWHITTFCEFC